MKTKLFIAMALFAIIAIAIIGCKEDEPDPPPPQPVAQSKTLEGVKNSSNATVIVTVYYTALPGVIPSYMSPLEVAVKAAIEGEAKSSPLTINVINDDRPFAIIDGVLTVGASWLANKDAAGILTGMQASIGTWTK